MRDSQEYLRCREGVLEQLKHRLETKFEELIGEVDEFVTDNFIEPGREAIDNAICDGEEAESSLAEVETERDKLSEKVDDLEQLISELRKEIAELQQELEAVK